MGSGLALFGCPQLLSPNCPFRELDDVMRDCIWFFEPCGLDQAILSTSPSLLGSARPHLDTMDVSPCSCDEGVG